MRLLIILLTPKRIRTQVNIKRPWNIALENCFVRGEAKFKELGLSDKSLSEEHLIKSMLEFPILIERPIVRTEKGVAIGRPPENVNSIL